MQISLQQVLEVNSAPIDWVVNPFIVREERVVVCGEWSAFKSWILLHLGLHIAAGIPWLGFPVQQSSVLYVDEEMHLSTLSRRLRRLCLGVGIQDAPFHVASREGLTVSGRSKLINEFDVIIVEALRRVLAGDENRAADISAFWRDITRMTKGSTLLISHHMNKPYEGGRLRDRPSGSTDIMAGGDAAYTVVRMGGSTSKIECIRSRIGIEPPPILVSVTDDRDATLITKVS